MATIMGQYHSDVRNENLIAYSQPVPMLGSLAFPWWLVSTFPDGNMIACCPVEEVSPGVQVDFPKVALHHLAFPRSLVVISGIPWPLGSDESGLAVVDDIPFVKVDGMS